MSFVDRFFKIQARGSTVQREVLGGMTTFAAMAYIAVVLPVFYVDAGMSKDTAVSAVVLVACLGTLLMGLVGNMPIAVAPGLGLAAYFAYTVCGSMQQHWQAALGATVVAGAIFFIIAFSGAWRSIVEAVPKTLRMSIAAGIGFFIAFVGLKNGGVIVAHESTYVALGVLTNPRVALTLGGVLLGAVLTVRKVPGSLFITMFMLTVIAMICGVAKAPGSLRECVSFISPFPQDSFMQFEWRTLWNMNMLQVVFAITLVGFFDSVGVLLSLGRKMGLTRGKSQDLNPEDIRGAMLSSSLATLLAGLLGTSVSTAYVESTAGVSAGARTGLCSVVTALLFGLMLFFLPLIKLVPPEVGSVALILIGALMIGEIRGIDFDDLTEGLPAFFTILMMVLTFSIAEGIAFGFLFYTLMKVCTGRYREVKPILYVLSCVFMVHLMMR